MADVGGPSAAARLCPQPDLLLALGIVSAPDYHMRRMAQRHSWMRWPNVGHFDGAAICASFIVRAGNAPAVIASALRREADAHGDMLLVSEIAHNESRVRGPLLSVAKWLLYAHSAMAHAAFIGKLDDDAYVHAPDLERMLRTAGTTFGPSANVYLGVLTWYSWYEQLFENTRHGWSYPQAWGSGAACRERPLHLPESPCENSGNCGVCSGPFAFAAGYLVLFSRPLVEGLVAAGGLEQESTRLKSIRNSQLLTMLGKPKEQVMEDIWLGHLLYRFPLNSSVKYVSLIGDTWSALHVDKWDFRFSRSALLVHIITKQLERYLVLHDYLSKPEWHCSRPFEIRCASYCATRADGGGHASNDVASAGDGSWSSTREKLSGKKQWCKNATAGHVADEWCTVHIQRPSEGEPPGCCGLGGNSTEAARTACTEIVGSNSWPVPYRQKLGKLKRRFLPVSATSIDSNFTMEEHHKRGGGGGGRRQRRRAGPLVTPVSQ